MSIQKTRNRQMNDGISANCDSYLNKLLKREVPRNLSNILMTKPTLRCPLPRSRDRSSSNQRPQSPSNLIKSRNSTTRQVTINTGNVQNDVYTDHSALVEVTVKAKKKNLSNPPLTNPPQPNPNLEKEKGPWQDILKSSMKKQDSMFSNFDPIRTVHFLAKELKFKLNSIAPDDANILQMFEDMELALKRIPPDVAANIKFKPEKTEKATHARRSKLSLRDEKPEKLIEIAKAKRVDRDCQTGPYLLKEETDKIQQLMEDSTLKLETSCRQMEMLCGRLKSEKDELKQQLKNEQENCKFLKQRVGELEIESDNHRMQVKQNNQERGYLESEIIKLQEERDDLRSEINTVSSLLDKGNKIGMTHMEINMALSDLKVKKDNLEQECANLKQELTTVQLEREKYVTIVAIRDRQISEIKLEMNQLQQVVSEQLTELNNNALSNMPSTESLAMESKTFMGKQNKQIVGAKNKLNNLSIKDSMYLFPNTPDVCSFRELPEGDESSLGILEDIEQNMKNSNPKGNKPSISSLGDFNRNDNIRDLFSELKRQAYGVTATQEPQTIKRYHSMNTISTNLS